MKYREYAPSSNLANIIQNFWVFEVYPDEQHDYPIQHETIPDCNVSLVLISQPNYRSLRLLGPHTKKFHLPIFANSIFLGLRFLPWVGFEPVLYKTCEILNQTCDAPEKATSFFRTIIDSKLTPGFNDFKKLEKEIKQLLTHYVPTQHNLVKYICFELEKGTPIPTIMEEIPASIRVVQKKFKEITGVTMKQYASVLRQRKLWSDLLVNKKTDVTTALDHGYFDHAHFINDFKKRMKRSPSEFKHYMHSIDISIL